VARGKEPSQAPRRLAVVSWRLALGILLVASACSSSGSHAEDRPRSATVPTASSAPTPARLRTCVTRDLHASADWEAGFVALGGSPGARTGGTEMTGLLKVWNVSPSSCDLPGRFAVRLVGATGVALPLRSDERDFDRYPYDANGPLVPGALAAAPIIWEPSWCGADPGLAPLMVVTLAPRDVPLRVHVTDAHPEFAHTPSCLRGARASVLVVAPFRQAQPG
jgi:hypothetical protein